MDTQSCLSLRCTKHKVDDGSYQTCAHLHEISCASNDTHKLSNLIWILKEGTKIEMSIMANSRWGCYLCSAIWAVSRETWSLRLASK